MNRTPALISVLIVIICILAALAYKFFLDRGQDATHRTQPPAIAVPAGGGVGQALPPVSNPALKKRGLIYVVSPSGGDDNNLVAEPVVWRSPQSPALDSLNALAQADNSPLPSGTHLRGVKLADGLATVDFSREFQENFHGGDTQEAQTINSILRTLGQFPTIDRVQILVEGRPIEALSQLPISGPLDVIRPDAVRQAQNSGG